MGLDGLDASQVACGAIPCRHLVNTSQVEPTQSNHVSSRHCVIDLPHVLYSTKEKLNKLVRKSSVQIGGIK